MCYYVVNDGFLMGRQALVKLVLSMYDNGSISYELEGLPDDMARRRIVNRAYRVGVHFGLKIEPFHTK